MLLIPIDAKTRVIIMYKKSLFGILEVIPN